MAATMQNQSSRNFSRLYFANDAHLRDGADEHPGYLDEPSYQFNPQPHAQGLPLQTRRFAHQPQPPKSILKTSTASVGGGLAPPISSTKLRMSKPDQPTVRYADLISTDAASGIVTTSADRRYTSERVPASPQSVSPSQFTVASASVASTASSDADHLEAIQTPADLHRIYEEERKRPLPVRKGYGGYYQQQLSPTRQQHPQQQFSYSPPSAGLRRAQQSPERRPPVPISGYYIDQKKRVDQSAGMLTSYTAPTVKEVFDDETTAENIDKYNPMEFVFTHKPEKEDSLRNVFKKQSTLDNYDYYEDRDRDKKKAEAEARAVAEAEAAAAAAATEAERKNASNKFRSAMSKLKLKKRTFVPVYDEDGYLMEENGYVLVQYNDGKKDLLKRRKVFPEEYQAQKEAEARAVAEAKAAAAAAPAPEGTIEVEYEDDNDAAGADHSEDAGPAPETEANAHYGETEANAHYGETEANAHYGETEANAHYGETGVDGAAAVSTIVTPVLGYLGSWASYAAASVPVIVGATAGAIGGMVVGRATEHKEAVPAEIAPDAVPAETAPEVVEAYEDEDDEMGHYEAEAAKPAVSSWKKLKNIGTTTKTKWQTLQQPAHHLFNGGFSAAEAAAIQRAQEKKRYRELGELRQRAVYDRNTNEIRIEYEDGEDEYETVYRDEEFNTFKAGDKFGSASFVGSDIESGVMIPPSPVASERSVRLPLSPGSSAGAPADGSLGGPTQIISNIAEAIKSIRIMRILFAPIDVIAEAFPTLQTVVILIELVIFVWILYELSLLIDALCMMVKAICAPMIAIGKFMNRVI